MEGREIQSNLRGGVSSKKNLKAAVEEKAIYQVGSYTAPDVIRGFEDHARQAARGKLSRADKAR